MSAQAKGLGAGPRSRFNSWLHHHRQSAYESLNKQLLTPISTLLTWLVLGISLALPATVLVALDNIDRLTAGVDRSTQFSLFLQADTEEAAAEDFVADLAQRSDVATATLIPADRALQEFAADTGLSAVVATLDDNPLPHTVVVRPIAMGAAALADLAAVFDRMPEVSQVVLDTRWIKRLISALEFGRRLTYAIGAMMLVGALLALANTIRLEIEARRAEIVVIKLIGASDGFARRPFLYTGLWYGIGGGVIASGLVFGLLWLLAPPVNELLRLYDSDKVLMGLGAIGALQLVLIGGAVGLMSAWQATAVHLRRVEPR
ncbi:cell division protein [Luminiphilus syltensis NOR5-1B]|uniref:Cell division protein FtsX n=1 Tax=Luminiphilus syltensis NOR5-1B TaxID=565045 RepID=B8KU87_9GAMM|nr:permease-like cell division protein FtsX [Luminiphilus syltensis]EED36769.1 cell division protein [Luminiphilus syltensis NOR5-1B]